MIANPLPVKNRPRGRRTTEEALIAAAAALFAEKGYDATTTRSIAEAAHCSEALIQRYFSGKEGLLLSVLDKCDDKSELANFLARPLCANLVEEARETMNHIVAKISSQLKRLRIVLSRVLVDPAFKEHFNWICAGADIQKGVQTRLTRYLYMEMVDPDIDIAAAAEILLCLSFDVAFMRSEVSRTSPAERDWLSQNYAEFFGRALAVSNSTPVKR